MSLTMLRRKPDRGLGNIHASASAPSRNIDWVLVGAQGLLAVIGLFVIYSASWSKYSDPFLFVTRQQVFLLVAAAAMVGVMALDYDWWRDRARFLYGATIVALVLLFLLGAGIAWEAWNMPTFRERQGDIFTAPGIVPGFLAGALAGAVGSGFLGAMAGGLLAGVVARWVSGWNVPSALRSLMPIVVNPLVSSVIVGLAMIFVIRTIVKPINEGLTSWLNGLGGGSLIVLGIILGLMMAFDIYLNKAAFEANEGIKFLTALTAVTLPAVLVGGWYGMNFDHMPELRSPHGYLYAAAFTLVSTVVMAVYLKKKRWF